MSYDLTSQYVAIFFNLGANIVIIWQIWVKYFIHEKNNVKITLTDW